MSYSKLMSIRNKLDLEVSVKLKDLPQEVRVNIHEDLIITDNIDGEIEEAPASYAYYAVIHEKAKLRRTLLEIQFKDWEKETERQIAQEISDSGSKALTGPQMDAQVTKDPNHRRYKETIAKRKYEENVFGIIADAFEKRISLIQTKAANLRKEAEGFKHGN